MKIDFFGIALGSAFLAFGIFMFDLLFPITIPVFLLNVNWTWVMTLAIYVGVGMAIPGLIILGVKLIHESIRRD